MNLWIVILIWLVIGAILILIIWTFWPRNSNNPPVNNGTSTTVGFLQNCGGDLRCGPDLTCVSGVCLKEEGQPCTHANDCAPPAHCIGRTSTQPGVCSIEIPGTLGGPCPCNNDDRLTCDPITQLCKLGTGVSGCGVSSMGDLDTQILLKGDCLSSDVCINNICVARKTEGESCNVGQCDANLFCSIGDCSNHKGFCQVKGVETCTIGASCATDTQPGCNQGLFCNTDTGLCEIGGSGLGDSCNTTTEFCINGLFCKDEICVFQDPPNDCSGGQGCPTGLSCMDGQCVVNKGDMCEINSNCLSTSCNSGLSNIYTWNVGILQWELYSSNPNPGAQFKRIVATTSITNDILWGLDFSTSVGKGGLWKLIDAKNGRWVKTSNCTTRTVMVDSPNSTQITTLRTIISIATDRRNIYALIETNTTILNLNNNQPREMIDWSVFKVGLNSACQATFTAVSGADPPQVGGDIIVNIIDFDVNMAGDILVVGTLDIIDSANTSPADNAIYSLPQGDESFALVSIKDPPDRIGKARFYFSPDATDSERIINSNNIGYVSFDDPNDELLQFTGTLANLSLPFDGRNNYTILDFSIRDYSTLTDIETWMIAPDPSSLNTGYYQILGRSQFNIPGYVGRESLIYVTNNRIYSQSSGVCI
jgi:hypothetical protein